LFDVVPISHAFSIALEFGAAATWLVDSRRSIPSTDNPRHSLQFKAQEHAICREVVATKYLTCENPTPTA
jgi:hypothetical protein